MKYRTVNRNRNTNLGNALRILREEGFSLMTAENSRDS
jgi:hypothetical protein